MMDRETYVRTIRDLLSKDPQRLTRANRELFEHVVEGGPHDKREADLALAEVGMESMP